MLGRLSCFAGEGYHPRELFPGLIASLKTAIKAKVLNLAKPIKAAEADQLVTSQVCGAVISCDQILEAASFQFQEPHVL